MAQQGRKKQTIALCMIVKNEAKVITRAFDSVKGFVDYYCICDTGSTDGTQDIIKDYLYKNDLSGIVHERPWVDFSHNRQEAFDLGSGKCDYIMTLDADEVFAPYNDKQPILTKRIDKLPLLKGDRVEVETSYGSVRYKRTQFFKDGLGWKWYWPIHESCASSEEKVIEVLEDACVVPTAEGARSKNPSTYHKDALVFENWLIDHPEDGRGWFYLSQSYRDAGLVEKAIDPLNKCLEKSKWDEEVFYCHLRLARYKLEKGEDLKDIMSHYWDAYNLRPHRAESLHDLIALHRKANQFVVAAMLGELALKIPYPKHDKLFVESEVYAWKLKDELSIAYYWTGKYRESIVLIEEFINDSKHSISDENRERIMKNLQYSKEKLHEGV